MGNFNYPTNAELTAILQEKLPVRMTEDALFDIMPLEEDDAALVMWEQEDNYTGLMALRGLEGQPSRVSKVGLKQYSMTPGAYGDFISLDETELTLGRGIGSFGTPISIEQTVLRRQDQLLNRAVDRLRMIGWTLVSQGTFSVPTVSGEIQHTDSFELPTFSATTAWSNAAQSTPLADLRKVRLMGRGKGASFASEATIYMNQQTFDWLAANSNQGDLGGRRTTNLVGPMNLEEINKIVLGDGLPKIKVYDDGYLNDAGTFVPFLADGKAVVVGKRPAGQRVAAFKLTRNASNEGAAPGMYSKVIDRGETSVPRVIEVHMGFNGGPVVYYPSAIVRISAGS